MNRQRSRVSPALVVAMIALLVALGGTSVAAVSVVLPKNSVGTAQLKNGAVTFRKLRNKAVKTAKLTNGAVTGAKIRNGTITGPKIKKGSLTADAFAPGQLQTGPAGPAGPAGPKGATGAPGISGLTIVQGKAVSGSGSHVAIVSCPANKKAIGGGYTTAGQPANLSITTATVLTNGVTYRVDGTSSTSSWNLIPFVYCATVAS